MDSKRSALTVKNSSIPRPVSKLPQPITRKRPLTQTDLSVTGKENAPAVKKLKTNTCKPAPTVTKASKPTSTRVTSKSLSARVVTKPAVKAITTKPAVKAVTTKPAVKAVTTKAKTAPSVVKKTGAAAKRPAWDIKGKLQDMAEEQKASVGTIDCLRTQLDSFASRLDELENVKQAQQSTIKVTEAEKNLANRQIKALEDQIKDTERAKEALERKVVSLEDSLESSHCEVTSLKSALNQTMARMSSLQTELEATKISRDSALADGVAKATTIASLENTVAQLKAHVEECKSQIREDEMSRRKLHNTIQELKGNIRVYCRVRPLLPTDPGYNIDDFGRESSVTGGSRGSRTGPTCSSLAITYPDSRTDQKKLTMELCGNEKGKTYDFSFDHVFGPDSTQLNVFSEISQLVQSALDGYNVCVFAYGQTGSGKTFTMEGPEEALMVASNTDMRGMVPRAVEQVFAKSVELRELGWEYKLEAIFLEIYNETLKDLLTTKKEATLEIKSDPQRKGEVYVSNVTPTVVTSQEQVQKLLERANKNRSVAATQCNERSSRSHSVFQFFITGNNLKTGETCRGVLNLIDLAGSERLSSSGSAGERLRETKNINKSLSNLGNVIMALANKDSHVPYRNSKLTYLLQNSLGGNSKTLMFVNISPQVESTQETLCSLRFATTVNQCNIGTARKATK